MIAGNSQKSLDTIEITHSPSLKTSIVEDSIIFLLLLKTILFSIKTFKPFTAINLNSSKKTPPSTWFEIEPTIAINLPKNPKIMANISASPITQTNAIFVIPTTDDFSP